MKKSISFFLIFVLILCYSSVAMADGEAKEYVWSERTDGILCYIEETDADFWLPDDFFGVELSEEDLAEDIIGFLANEEGSYTTVFYSKDGSFSLHTFFGYCMDEGLDAEVITVNGVPALLLRDASNNTASLIFQTLEKNILQLTFSPLSNEALMDQVFSSVRPHKVIEEETTQPVQPTNPVSHLISK